MSRRGVTSRSNGLSAQHALGHFVARPSYFVVAASVVVGGSVGLIATGRVPGSLIPIGWLELLILLVCVVAWRKPTLALIVLVSTLPFQHLLLSWAFSKGVAGRSLILARSWKELILIVLVVRTIAARHKQFAPVDRLILAFLGVVGVYVLIPLGPSLYVRVIAARQIAAFLVLFLVARHHVGLDGAYSRVEAAVLVTGTAVAALAFWNTFQPEAFRSWIESTGLGEYSVAVFGVPAYPTLDRASIGGLEYLRAGSTFLFPVTLAYYLLIPIGLVLGRAARGQLRIGHAIAGSLCVGGLVLSLTRSAVAAVPFMFVLAFLIGRKRVALLAVLAVSLALAVPILGAVAGGDRLNPASEIANSSTAVHLQQLGASIDRLESRPLGSGLGTAGGISTRFDVPGSIVNESWYLQVGTELGVFGMLLYVTALLSVLHSLWLAASLRTPLSLGPLCALAGIALGGIVLHTLEEFSVAWSVWLLAGLSLRSVVNAKAEPALAEQDLPRLAAIRI